MCREFPWVFYDDKYYLPSRVTLLEMLEKGVITALDRKLNSVVGTSS